jgi:hypothetical protein
VAKVMTKAALLEHIWTSGSWLMIFLTLDTEQWALVSIEKMGQSESVSLHGN